MLKKVDHVIILVANVDKAAADYRKILGLTPEDGRIRELPQARVAMLPVPKGARIELVERKKPDNSRFAEFIRTHGEGVMGLSIFMDDFDSEIAEMKKKGVQFTLEEQKDLHAGHPFRMAWVPPQEAHGVWLEIVDSAALPPHLRD
jgi:catechol 2,3-dioxygenase-like lactoylglutathione lyase family enzyme